MNEQEFECRNYINCGEIIFEGEYCENCLDEMSDQPDGSTAKLDAALNDLENAVEFFNKVQAATLEEKQAVGSDHYDWLVSAARGVVESR